MVCHGFMVAIRHLIEILIAVHYHELEPPTAMWGNMVAAVLFICGMALLLKKRLLKNNAR